MLPLEDQVFGDGQRASLESFVARFVAIMTLVLIAATVNVAGLLLARGMARRQEFALRASLGCGRGQLLRQLFVEGLCLALLGAVAGTVLAWLAIPLFDRLLLPVDLKALALAPSARILGAAALGAVASSLVFSFFPLAGALRLDLVAALRGLAGLGLFLGWVPFLGGFSRLRPHSPGLAGPGGGSASDTPCGTARPYGNRGLRTVLARWPTLYQAARSPGATSPGL